MITKEQEEKLKRIYKHFGFKCQKEKLWEEMGEYAEEVHSLEFFTKNEKEELVDMYVVLTQLILFSGYGNNLEKIVDYKINRTLERIESEYYEK